jgi:hypothetical protein
VLKSPHCAKPQTVIGHFINIQTMKEFEDIVLTAYIVLIGLLSAILISRYWYYRKTRKARTKIFSEPKFIVFCRIVTVLVISILILGFVNYLFILQKGNLFAPYWGKVSVVSLLTLLCISEIIYNLYPLPTKTNRILNIVFLIPLSGFAFLFTQTYLKAINHPAESSSIIIELPFEGTWIASGAGGSGITNHHDRIESQKYAIDIVKFGDNNRLFENEGIKNEDSYTFGAKVISPVNGKIVFALDTLPDVKNTDKDKLAGNHIIIQFQDTLFVALAHLKQNSIQVKQGDIVGIGQELALVGNSGNTDFPHLHIHIQDTETYDITTSKTFPIRFRTYKRMRYLFWTRQTNNFLLSNDIVKPN